MALGFEDIDDTICTHCGGDNMTDYPVCPHCAKRLHFDYRVKLGRTCLHCIHVAKSAGTEVTTKPANQN